MRELTLHEVYDRIIKTYVSQTPRTMLVSAQPNDHRLVDTFFLAINGSTPKGYGIYCKSSRWLYIIDAWFRRKRKQSGEIFIPRLAKLRDSPGTYVYTPQADKLRSWTKYLEYFEQKKQHHNKHEEKGGFPSESADP